MPITPLPSLDRTSPTFRTEVDTFFSTQLPTFVTETNSVASDVETAKVETNNSAAASADSAAASANSADESAASAVTAGQMATLAEAAIGTSSTPPFVSGQTVAVGDVRYSPTSFETYRAKTAGVRTTDPSADETNWHSLGSAQAQSAALLWAFAFD